MKMSKWTWITFFSVTLFFNMGSVASTKEGPICDGAVIPARVHSGLVALSKASQDRIHVIDIAFIYPRSVNRNDLVQNIETAVLETNIIFAQANVNARLRTVAIQPDSKYAINLYDVGVKAGLKKVQSILSEVREDYGADLVYGLTSSLETGSSCCGTSYLRVKGMSRAEAASYSVGVVNIGNNSTTCLVNRMTLARQIGYNLGLDHHDRGGSSSPFVSYGKSYTGRNINNQTYSTIMGTEGTRLSGFSIDSSQNGLRMGTSEANAAEALLYTIEDASNYAETKIKGSEPEYVCTESETNSCLQNSRFRVEVRVSYIERDTGVVKYEQAKVKKAMLNGTNKTNSLFYFFSEDNPELLVKVLNGCGVNGKYWVFGSAGTDLDYSVSVTDNATGVRIPYYRNSTNPLINDISAFPCHPQQVGR